MIVNTSVAFEKYIMLSSVPFFCTGRVSVDVELGTTDALIHEMYLQSVIAYEDMKCILDYEIDYSTPENDLLTFFLLSLEDALSHDGIFRQNAINAAKAKAYDGV